MDAMRLDAGGASLLVRSWGDPHARPLFCWHGLGFRSPASLTFANLAPRLSEHGMRVVALDAPGYGSSPPLAIERYHPHALADLVPPILDSCELNRTIFMGFSWGGDIGCHVAARHPTRLSGLVLLDAGYVDPPFDASLPYARYLELNEHRAAETDASVHPQVVAAIEFGMANAPPSTTRDAIASSKLPVLLVAARGAPGDDLKRFVRDVPQAEVHRANGLDHNVLADGGRTVESALIAWLDSS
jgi:pimeloyl-ACP methyl ester carboxylesterase